MPTTADAIRELTEQLRADAVGKTADDLAREGSVTQGITARLVDDIHKEVFGNGRPGLKDRVQVLETVSKEHRTSRVWLLGLGSLIVAVAAVIVAVFK